MIIVVILLLVQGEYSILGGILSVNHSNKDKERFAEVVANKLTFAFLSTGVKLLMFIYFLNWLGLDFNELVRDFIKRLSVI